MPQFPPRYLTIDEGFAPISSRQGEFPHVGVSKCERSINTSAARDARQGACHSTFASHLKINRPHTEIRRRWHHRRHQPIDVYELWKRQTSRCLEILSPTKKVGENGSSDYSPLAERETPARQKTGEQFTLLHIFPTSLMITSNSALCQFISLCSTFLHHLCLWKRHSSLWASVHTFLGFMAENTSGGVFVGVKMPYHIVILGVQWFRKTNFWRN